MQPRVAWLLFCSRLAKSAPPRGGVFRWVNKTQPVLSITLGCLPPRCRGGCWRQHSLLRAPRTAGGLCQAPRICEPVVIPGEKGEKKGCEESLGARFKPPELLLNRWPTQSHLDSPLRGGAPRTPTWSTQALCQALRPHTWFFRHWALSFVFLLFWLEIPYSQSFPDKLLLHFKREALSVQGINSAGAGTGTLMCPPSLCRAPGNRQE